LQLKLIESWIGQYAGANSIYVKNDKQKEVNSKTVKYFPQNSTQRFKEIFNLFDTTNKGCKFKKILNYNLQIYKFDIFLFNSSFLYLLV